MSRLPYLRKPLIDQFSNYYCILYGQKSLGNTIRELFHARDLVSRPDDQRFWENTIIEHGHLLKIYVLLAGRISVPLLPEASSPARLASLTAKGLQHSPMVSLFNP